MAPAAFEIPRDAGPAGSRGWHDVVSRGTEIAFARRPRVRAELVWALDREFRRAKAVMAAFVATGDVVLDLGANWGLFTHRLAAAVGPAGRVLAFEPNPLQLESLRRVAARCGNVDVHPVALSDRDGDADLRVPLVQHRTRRLRDRPMHAMASIAVPRHRADRPHQAVSRVAVRRLDDLVGDDVGRIAFVKCDVEGHELAVLRGAGAVLRRWTPPLLIEIEQRHQETPVTDVFDLLASYGYDGYVLHGRPRPVSEFDVWRDQVRHLKPNALFSAAPDGYLHDFLFVPAGTPLQTLDTALSSRMRRS